MDDLIAGFRAAPFWAQVGIAFFVVTFLVMLIEPRIKRRKYAATASWPRYAREPSGLLSHTNCG